MDKVCINNNTRDLVDILVDARTGVINHSASYQNPVLPDGLIGWNTSVSDTRMFDIEQKWHANAASFGASLKSPSHAVGASVGEAIERYCGNIIPQNLVFGSWHELSQQGLSLIHPDDLCLYSDEQYETKNFPFKRFSLNTRIHWVLGVNTQSKEEKLIPAPLVFLDYYTGERKTETPITALQYSGIAAGVSVVDAIDSAILELVERDTLVLWWLSRSNCIEITDWEQNTATSGLLWDTDYNRVIRVFLLKNEWKLPVVFVTVWHQNTKILSFGSACRKTLREAIEKAICEAFSTYCILTDLTNPNSPVFQAVKSDIIPSHTYKPYLENRSYSAAYAKDFSDMLDLPAVGQFYLDPVIQKHFWERIHELREPGTWVSCSNSVNMSENIKERFSDYEILAVDVTSSDMLLANIRVVRVVIPHLYNNPAPAYPYLGGKRLYSRCAQIPNIDLPIPII